LQYINGRTWWHELELIVRTGVLIPRPETELLVEAARERMPDGGFSWALDIGCGTGAIGLALLHAGIAERIVMVDSSREAARLSYENARQVLADPDADNDRDKEREATFMPGLREERGDRSVAWYREGDDIPICTILHSDALQNDWLPRTLLPALPEQFPLIASNPPYIRRDEWPTLQHEVREHEPREALLSGADGLDAHRALSKLAPSLLTPDGWFLGEIGAEQGEAVRFLYTEWAEPVEILPDLAGRDRIVAARNKVAGNSHA
ncbi:methyltransferase, partial [bacterium]|nr:methyltransferase [bacterium]